MTKKTKIIATFLLLLAVILSMTFVVFALNSSVNIGINNKLKFTVDDIQGDFYYSITGQKDKARNVGLTHIFSSEYVEALDPIIPGNEGLNEDSNPWIIQQSNAEGLKDEQGVLVLSNEKGLKFEEKEGGGFDAIHYYFIFINRGKTTVQITTQTDSITDLATEHGVDLNWSFDNSNTITKSDFDIKHLPNTEMTNIKSCGSDGIPGINEDLRIAPAEIIGGTTYYHYAIIDFCMHLVDNSKNNEYDQGTLSLTINFNSIKD